MDIFKLVGSVFVDTGEANNNLDKTKGKAEKTSSSFSSMAKKAGKAAIAIGTSAAGIAAGAVKIATKTADAADEVDKMSQKLGISRKSYQELDYVLSQSGADISSMSGGMKTLLKNMDAVTEGNKTSIANFEKLGISVTDANGDLRDQEDVLYDVITAFQDMEDGAEKDRLAQELLGKSGQELLPLLNSEAGSFKKLTDKANDLGLVMGDDVIDAGVDMKDNLDTVQKSLGAMANKIGAKVLPMVNDFLTWVEDHMPEIEEFFDNACTVIGVAFDTVSTVWNDTLLPALEELWDVVKNKIWPIMKEVWEDYVGPTISAVFNSISDVWNNTLKPAFDAMKGALDKLKEKWEDVWDNIKDYVEPILTWLKEKIGGVQDIIDSLRDSLLGLGNLTTLMNTGKNLGDAAKNGGKLPGQASGGYTVDPGWSWVGEHGPELAYMPKGATVVPMDKSPVVGSGRTDELLEQLIYVMQNQKIELDGREMGRMVRSYA